ncbi:MAG TPA: glycosyltransferase 87 family protein [Candidatus Dormibacteraeota bacterium]|nr:glycosyltransferase 87 family protein [Candidatus Dormibacteraeota bacterium]
MTPNFGRRLWLTLLNRRFRTVLLAMALVPIATRYAESTVVTQLMHPIRGDFLEVYVAGAKVLASGGDPYSSCLSTNCYVVLQNGWWFYPPAVLWLFQPLTRVGDNVANLIAVFGAQLCVAVFLWVMARAMNVRDWQVIALWILAVISFPPVMSEVAEGNLQILLLAISAAWFAGWLAGDRWWAGAALGAGLALKLVQAPLLVIAAWSRRFRAAIAAALTLSVVWLVGAPQYLVEYLVRILPAVSIGTGGPMNVSTFAVVARLLHPGSLYGYGTGMDTTVRVIGYAVAATAVVTTALVLRAPREDRDGRALEVAAAVAVSPLLVAEVRPGQLLLLLLPMMVLGTIAMRRGDWRLGAAVAASWALIGPGYLWASNALAAGLAWPLLRLTAETAFVGTLILWLASLQALRIHAPAVEDGAVTANRSAIGSIYT